MKESTQMNGSLTKARSPISNTNVAYIFTTKNWLYEIKLGNDASEKGQVNMAHEHYKNGLDIAKKILKAQQYSKSPPDILIPAIVVPCLNIFELWPHNDKSKFKAYICKPFDYLIQQGLTPGISDSLKNQICCGLDKLFFKIIEIGDIETVNNKRKALLALHV